MIIKDQITITMVQMVEVALQSRSNLMMIRVEAKEMAITMNVIAVTIIIQKIDAKIVEIMNLRVTTVKRAQASMNRITRNQN
jgi:uncharacterized protein YqfB (UPF0267 family)